MLLSHSAMYKMPRTRIIDFEKSNRDKSPHRSLFQQQSPSIAERHSSMAPVRSSRPNTTKVRCGQLFLRIYAGQYPDIPQISIGICNIDATATMLFCEIFFLNKFSPNFSHARSFAYHFLRFHLSLILTETVSTLFNLTEN